MSKFKITNHKGFRMGFENGFEISVHWGPGNYCERQDEDFNKPEKSDFWSSRSAEIAIFDTNNRIQENSSTGMISLGRDTVEGWVSADQVAKVIAIVQSSKQQKKYNKNIKL